MKNNKACIRNNVEIILVEPEEPGNIGATCRAMNNMGFENLSLVNPGSYKNSEAYKFAWNSHHILNNVKIFDSIPSAIQDKSYVIAMSARKSKNRGRFDLLHECAGEIMSLAADTKVAFLFGRESTGLTNEEMIYANRMVTIPTFSTFSSLNLAQSVLVTCYELSKSQGVKWDQKPEPAPHEELEQCFSHVEKVLHLLGYGTLKGDPLLPKNIMKSVRLVSGRALLDSREIRMIRGLCAQVEKMINGFQLREKTKGGEDE